MRALSTARRGRQRGFTLVELILVIVLCGIVGAMVSSVLSRPLEGFVAQSRRAELVDIGAGALNRMQRDIRMAVPGSVRVSADGQALELLLIHSAGRYLPNRPLDNSLNFSATPAAQCNGPLVAGVPACDVLQVFAPDFVPPASGWLVVASSLFSPWSASNPGSITPTNSVFTRLAESNTAAWPGISLIRVTPPGGAFAFAAPSAQRRIYFADRVVGYRCSGGQLLRYEHDQLQATLPATLPAAGRLQADRVTSCDFRFASASSLASLQLSIGAGGESIRLAQQVQVNNAP
ncbi:prepilin-type N-terminal cleavage/methylation domain-containing protein [Pseudomonas sp. GCM10022188]|uniref:prepilin-type N-terminal cleavage/methylation domain-containing protein n=1 Tax=Pseudomonas TaxID=286 RepID=UPI001E3E5983|nr:prepilin-type N-terminal cleavage/methylation domain-containing protein [Pseudomonas oryzagri]MCC6077596.1 prepilin-type N-terminal cleavage/methylation domain-containing protein [Pseudomonas oryzagri]